MSSAESPRDLSREQLGVLVDELKQLRTAYKAVQIAREAQTARIAMLEQLLFLRGVQPFCILCGVGLTQAQMEAGQPYCATCDALDPVIA